MVSADAESPGHAPDSVPVTVAYSPTPREVDQVVLRLPAGSTVRDAVQASGLLQRHGLPADVALGVWGKPRPGDTPLRAHDRVELYRALRVDPKEARRQRYRGQKPRGAKPAAG